MPNYFELLTDLPAERIHSLTDGGTTHPREAKDILGRIVVEAFHDCEAANRASEEFRRRFSEGQLPTDIETRLIAASPIGLLRLLVEVGFAASNSEARRLVEGGGVSLDGTKLSDPKATITIEGEPVLKVGKRRVCRVAVGS
jgi:tyrosyl-tRNA synthetase